MKKPQKKTRKPRANKMVDRLRITALENFVSAFEKIVRGYEMKEDREEHVVDCSLPPFVPEGWTIAEESEQIASRLKGKFAITPETLALYLDPGQDDGWIVGTDLRTRLAGKTVLPANVLDYLLVHPELIPESWKWHSVFFWGTIYSNAVDGLSVRYPHWSGESWSWSYYWLGYECGFGHPAAVLV
jgi:hypothetical protein